MANLKYCSALVLSLLSCTALLSADTLSTSVSGTFPSSVSPTLWAAPNSAWSLSFNLDRSPLGSNVSNGNFDVAFSNFQYLLQGKDIAVVPEWIRFYSSSNSGLFTIFFGPETGFSGGTPIPEFEFNGPQAFTGFAGAPIILTGSFPVTEWFYSDSANFEDQYPASNVVAIAAAAPSPAPEPTSMLLLVMASIVFFFFRKLVSCPGNNDISDPSHNHGTE